jgi:hypothetical protein
MGDDVGKVILVVVGSILSLATISVVLSKQSDTPGLIQALGTTLSRVIAAAVTPLPQAKAVTSNVGGVSSLIDIKSALAGDINFGLQPLF